MILADTVTGAATSITARPLLADYTTLRVGGPARRMIVAATEHQLVEVVRDCDVRSEPMLLIGGGSNVLIGDDGFDGTVIRVATRGISADVSACSGTVLTVAAGEVWDDFVKYAVAQGWSGLEALSGIPGLVGATPIQNVGAYGAEVSQTIAWVRTIDRSTGQQVTFAAADCGFSYRNSRFKAEPGRYLVVSVTFQLPAANLSAPIRYPELAHRLGAEVGQRVESASVRDAVLALRNNKGLVLNAADHDTWSAGSFFTNPLLAASAAERLPSGAPRFLQPGGIVKTSAAWLIEQAGYGKGYGIGAASLSTKHVLALTNRGSARAEDLVALAREVRDGVRRRFDSILQPEPVLVGCVL